MEHVILEFDVGGDRVLRTKYLWDDKSEMYVCKISREAMEDIVNIYPHIVQYVE